ncbi:hypothetical protein [Gordonia sp. NPDC003429]
MNHQTEARRQRRAHLSHQLDGEFDLATEVSDILTPLAERVTAEPAPASHLPEIENVVAAVEKIVRFSVELVARRDAERKVRDLPTYEQRSAGIAALMMLVEYPPTPVIARVDAVSGEWAVILAAHVRPVSASLADLLDHARPTGGRTLSVSERVIAALRGLDRAAITLEKRLDWAASTRTQLARTPATETPADQARRVLDALGVQP